MLPGSVLWLMPIDVRTRVDMPQPQCNARGQVSTEYLVILAVVLVVALVVVYLVGGFSILGSGSLATQSRDYWGSTSPLAITAVKVASPNSVALQVANDGMQPLTLTEIDLVNSSIGITTTLLNPGQSTVLSGTLPAGVSNCTTGQPFTYNNVTLYYTTGTISAIKETGIKGLVGTCS
jgi:hypothetical protein